MYSVVSGYSEVSLDVFMYIRRGENSALESPQISPSIIKCVLPATFLIESMAAALNAAPNI